MARDKDAQALPEGQAEKPKKKNKIKRLVIILAIVIMTLGAAGLGAYWWFVLRTPSAGSEAPQTEAAQPAPAGQPAAPAGADATPPAAQAPAPAGNDGARVERQTDLPRSQGLVLPLPDITVNLSDPTGRRYLKLGMEVEVNSDVSAELQARTARIRDAIIMLLAGKTVSDITTPEGKILLKAEVASRLNQILGAQRVIRVYFTDFVVQ